MLKTQQLSISALNEDTTDSCKRLRVAADEEGQDAAIQMIALKHLAKTCNKNLDTAYAALFPAMVSATPAAAVTARPRPDGRSARRQISTGTLIHSGKPMKRADTFDFSEAKFLKLGTTSITTGTRWTPTSVLVGPLLVDGMRAVGVTSGTRIFKTIDDCSAPIP